MLNCPTIPLTNLSVAIPFGKLLCRLENSWKEMGKKKGNKINGQISFYWQVSERWKVIFFYKRNFIRTTDRSTSLEFCTPMASAYSKLTIRDRCKDEYSYLPLILKHVVDSDFVKLLRQKPAVMNNVTKRMIINICSGKKLQLSIKDRYGSPCLGPITFIFHHVWWLFSVDTQPVHDET